MGEPDERFASFKRMVREALLVYSRMPDVDARFRTGLRAKWGFSVVYEEMDYGVRYDPPWLKHVASPQEITEMEAVMGWMAWLRRQPGQGEPAIRRIIGWAMGTPISTLAWREHRCERTIENRIDRSLALIFCEFLAVIVMVDVVDEPPKRREHIRGFGERAVMAGAPETIEPGKIWIDGIGFMFHGEKFDPEGDALKAIERRKR